jgi:hypothetical protein
MSLDFCRTPWASMRMPKAIEQLPLSDLVEAAEPKDALGWTTPELIKLGDMSDIEGNHSLHGTDASYSS